MKNFKHSIVAGLTVAAVIGIGGCAKQNSAPAIKTAPVATQAAAMEASVLTPAGYMPKSRVHFIADGFEVSTIGGHYKKVESATGKIVQDFGAVEPVTRTMKNGIAPRPFGWITYANWANDTTIGTPINYFTTTWMVPLAPKTDNGQTIFLFNGMQDGLTPDSHIIQPVLQWGPSSAGGGSYWSITNWYVGSDAFYGTLVTVAAGKKITGIMQTTGQAGKLFSYNSKFLGYAHASQLQVNNVPQMWWAAETLETYGVTVATDNPASMMTRMNSIEIKTGSADAALSWTAVKVFPTIPQKTVVMSNSSPGGEVDIYYHN